MVSARQHNDIFVLYLSRLPPLPRSRPLRDRRGISRLLLLATPPQTAAPHAPTRETLPGCLAKKLWQRRHRWE
ncbi:hypothetical protein O3P69_002592 [Scylla paramamosain]|uniref:Uncharacterized protein n=1 Tax=Scylla paramamosain TaxID=85552 RepID=A0AAW0UM16_SCYPA